MDNIEINAIQITLFLFFTVMFDPILSRKIGEWF